MPRRLALLVATHSYSDSALSQLTSPGYDAESLAETLGDQDIAGFDVTTLVNQPNHVVGRAIGEFFSNCQGDDLAFLYFTGHGLKDDHGDLYLAMTDTQRDNLLYTAISAVHIDRSMESCLSRQKVLVLDCCYSGAFPSARIPKAGPDIHAVDYFQGKGRVVLTASDSTQYSFEGNEATGNRSLFTQFLVEGLRTGDADLDRDGDISLDELYNYVRGRVIEVMPQQRPKKLDNVEGSIIIARNVHWCLPEHLRSSIESPIAENRLVAIDGLARLYRVGNQHVRAAVSNEIQRLIDDDSKAVSLKAAELINAMGSPESQRSATSRHGVRNKITLPSYSRSTFENVKVSHVENDSSSVYAFWPLRSWPPNRQAALLFVSVVSVIAVVIFLFAPFAHKNLEPSTSLGAQPSAPSVPAGGSPQWNLSSISTGIRPFSVAVAPDNRHVYVTNADSGTVSVLDVTTGATRDVKVGETPDEVAVTRDGRKVYVNNHSSNDVSVIDPASGTVTKSIPVGDKPSGVAFTADGGRAYVSNFRSGDVSVIDTASGILTNTVIIGDSLGSVAVAPDSRHVYVTVDTGYVSVIDSAHNTVIRSIQVGNRPDAVAVTPDNRHVYVANSGSGDVSVIDVESGSVTASIPVGAGPHGLAVAPDGRHVYVANSLEKKVSVIDVESGSVTASIPVGAGPRGLAVAPDGRHVYVANSLSATLSIIEIPGR